MKLFSWKYEPSGACPVQAEGQFLGHYFYFRSRWNTASIEFAETEAAWDKWSIIKRIELKHYGGADAGWIPKQEATCLVYLGCVLYCKLNEPLPPDLFCPHQAHPEAK